MGGSVGGFVNNIGSGLSTAANNIGNSIGTGLQNIGNSISQPTNNLQHSLTHLSDWTGGDPAAPTAPGVNPALTNLQTQQQTNATNFRNNIPQMEQSMGEQLKSQANQMMGQGMSQINNSNNARGMGYGGVNQGQQQKLRAQTQSGVAQGQSNINAGLQNAANTLDAEAVNTGVGIQQTQQSIQNQIYSQAMTQMNANNSMVGGFLETGLLAALVLA